MPSFIYGSTFKIFYKNQMSENYKTDERVLKSMIKSNVKCINPDDKIKFSIYYKNKKSAELILKNSPRANSNPLQKTNVIYEFSCNTENCEFQASSKYIGCTVTTLSRRLTMHLQGGGPFCHMKNVHNTKITREQLVNQTKIINQAWDRNRLEILEALLIQKNKPAINNQATGVVRTLHLTGINT